MEITDVKVIPVDDEKLKAFVSIVFDQCFVVTDIKIIHGPKGLFVSMPSKKRKDGTFKDIAHPLNNQMRQYLEDKVLSVYKQQVAQPAAASGTRRDPAPRRGPSRRTTPRGVGLRAAPVGAWPSGKARGFGPRIRRFESFRPSHLSENSTDMSRDLKVFTGTRAPRPWGVDRPFPGTAPRPRPPVPLQRRRGLVPDPGQRARRRRLRGPAHRARR